MRVEIDLPDWCNERHIYVIAGTELAAYKEAQEGVFHVKTSRCNNCGLCCMGLPEGHVPTDGEGTCLYLARDGVKKICSLGATRPWPCIEGDPVKGKWANAKSICSIRYDGDK
jgi:hypothetical protein